MDSFSVSYSYFFRNTVNYPNTTTNRIYEDYSTWSNVSAYNGDTLSKVDSIFVYDRYYTKVMRYSNHADANETNLKTVYYANSAYGILRKEVFNTNGTLKSKALLKNKNIIR